MDLPSYMTLIYTGISPFSILQQSLLTTRVMDGITVYKIRFRDAIPFNTTVFLLHYKTDCYGGFINKTKGGVGTGVRVNYGRRS